MTVTLPFRNEKEIADAATFISRLIPGGALFSAVIRQDSIVITFSGGY